MKWELRRFGERGEQDQSDDTGVRRVPDDLQPAAEQFGQASGTTGFPEQYPGGQESKATSSRDDQGL